MNRRPKRVASLLRAEIARLLNYEMDDPVLASVSVTDLELSNDLRTARVYYNLAVEVDAKELNKAFKRATPYLKSQVAETIQMRYVPDLRFVRDDHMAEVSRVMGILDSIRDGGEVAEEQQQ